MNKRKYGFDAKGNPLIIPTKFLNCDPLYSDLTPPPYSLVSQTRSRFQVSKVADTVAIIPNSRFKVVTTSPPSFTEIEKDLWNPMPEEEQEFSQLHESMEINDEK